MANNAAENFFTRHAVHPFVSSTAKFEMVAGSTDRRLRLSAFSVYNKSAVDSAVDFFSGLPDSDAEDTLIWCVPAPAMGGATLSFPAPCALPCVVGHSLKARVHDSVDSITVSVLCTDSAS